MRRCAVTSNLKQLRCAMSMLEEQGMEMDSTALSTLIRQARDAASVSHIHQQLNKHQRELHPTVANALVEMYGKCGAAQEARKIFDNLRAGADVYSWNLMLCAYANSGMGREALELFKQMIDVERIQADRVSFIIAVRACCMLGCLSEGKSLHQIFISTGLESSIILDSALVNMYGRCGNPAEARRLFDRMPDRNLVCWNTMVSAYAANQHHWEARNLYHEMSLLGIRPDRITFLNVLTSCETAGLVRAIHEQVISAGLASHRFVCNALITSYGKAGAIDAAQEVFESIAMKDVISWNSIIAVYAEQGMSSDAYRLFRSMGVKPDSVTFTILLGCLESLPEGRAVHARMLASSGSPDWGVVAETALLSMYGRCGSIDEARNVFDAMKERTQVTWNAMITAYAHGGHPEQAMSLFREMLGVAGMAPNSITFMALLSVCSELEHVREIESQILDIETEQLANTMISAFSRTGSLDDADRVFRGFRERMRGKISVVCWTCLIEALVEHGAGKQALNLFREMVMEGIRADSVAFVCALECCGSIGDLRQGRGIHRVMEQERMEVVENVIVGTVVVNMYGKCGSVAEARCVFDRMWWRNIVTWNSMIGAYAQHGHLLEAVRLYEELEQEGVDPDGVTFLCILFACSHLGLMFKGREVFGRIQDHSGIEAAATHFGCVVDLLCRAGWMEEAEELVRSMPVQPGVTAWTALLGACKVHNDAERGVRAALQLQNLDPQRITALLLV